MDALARRRLWVSTRLRTRPVVPAMFSTEDVDAFVESDAPTGIVANLDLLELEAVTARLAAAERFAFVNADSVGGLQLDRGGIDFLAKIGATGVITTRGSVVSRIEASGMVAMQKLFVTDRLNLPRSTVALRDSLPSYVQIMPAPVLPYVMDEPVMGISPVIAGGFVTNERSLLAALACGAAGVSSSQRSLWNYQKEQT